MKKYAFAALIAALTVAAVGCTGKKPASDEVNTDNPADAAGTEDVSAEAPDAAEEVAVPEDIADVEGFRPMPVWEIYGDSMEKAGDETHPHVYAEFPAIVLGEDTEKAYPEFAKSMTAFNDEFRQYAAAFVGEYGGIEVEEAINENAEWDSTETMDPQRFDTIVASFELYSYAYTGGAHGYGGKRGVTYDMMTGKKLTLSDVFTDIKGVIVRLDDKLLSTYQADSFFEPETLEQTFVDTLENGDGGFAWCLTEDGVRFYFNPYEIGPYSSGVFEADFTYEELGELFNAAYLPAVG